MKTNIFCISLVLSIVITSCNYASTPIPAPTTRTMVCGDSTFTITGAEVVKYVCGYSLIWGIKSIDILQPQLSVEIDTGTHIRKYDITYKVIGSKLDIAVWEGDPRKDEAEALECSTLGLTGEYQTSMTTQYSIQYSSAKTFTSTCSGENFSITMATSR